MRRIAAIFAAMKLPFALASLTLSLLLGATGAPAADSLAKTPPAVLGYFPRELLKTDPAKLSL